jgi:hypothetical protein
MTKKTNWDYSSPECQALDISLEGVLCGSDGVWGETEDMGNLEDIFGNKGF